MPNFFRSRCYIFNIARISLNIRKAPWRGLGLNLLIVWLPLYHNFSILPKNVFHIALNSNSHLLLVVNVWHSSKQPGNIVRKVVSREFLRVVGLEPIAQGTSQVLPNSEDTINCEEASRDTSEVAVNQEYSGSFSRGRNHGFFHLFLTCFWKKFVKFCARSSCNVKQLSHPVTEIEIWVKIF